MTDLRKAAEMALEALMQKGEHHPKVYQAAEALRQALAQPVDAVNILQERVDKKVKGEQEPVAFVNGYFGGYLTITCFDSTLVLPDGLALYTAPPKREWVGLTYEEVHEVLDDTLEGGSLVDVCRAIEQQLKEKNT